MGVVLLAGGTGAAKLARGLLDAAGDELTVIANTGDDIEIHGSYVSPDPDLVTFWLADAIDERGWGLAGDSFVAMDEMRALGADVWFSLGDRDLGICLHRARRLADGATLTQVADELRLRFGIPAHVLPMSDQPVRTQVRARDAWHPFQHFMIRESARGPVDDVHFNFAARSAPTDAVLQAIAAAHTIVIGPSNPVISIGPILALAGMREALREAGAPVIAVSPLVRGSVLKGPTDVFMAWAGQPLSSDGIATHYAGLIDGLVADEPAGGVPTRVCDVELNDPRQRLAVARATLEHAAALSSA